jgi:hypothetical protein
MFAVDCPLDGPAQACVRFDTAEITERDRSKIGRDNAMTLFGLGRSEMILTVCSFRKKVSRRGTAIMLACYEHAQGSRQKERTIMLKTVFAMAVAALVFAAVSGTSQAVPIAPLQGATSADTGTVTQVRWYGHRRHCWRGPYGHLHCGW